MTDIKNVKSYVKHLISYGRNNGLISERDEIYSTNRLLESLHIDSFSQGETDATNTEIPKLENILSVLLDYAAHSGVIQSNDTTHRDLFDTKLMGCITPPPSYVSNTFWQLFSTAPEEATNYFYKLSQDTDYIRRYRIKKDIRWSKSTAYGKLDLTINLAKPEKDPKSIMAAAKQNSSNYPKCLLCPENEGYAGHSGYPSRQNHRIVPIKLAGEKWYFQYSPYTYYNEHCIVLSHVHRPMCIDFHTFERLLDFVDLFPHYFIGSNSDLPIVGGSILSHDHLQGGNYVFAMENADIISSFNVQNFSSVTGCILKWPLSVIRLMGKNRKELISFARHILERWREYSDESVNIYAQTDGTPHNTITPIARKRNGVYQLDIVLRNNITTPEHPEGVFHPHRELQHIKKENIGLIEVMGLAVLPARLKHELSVLRQSMLNNSIASMPEISHHADWATNIQNNHDLNANNIDKILLDEVGSVFCEVLESAGVFKQTPNGQSAFAKFIKHLDT